MLVDIFGLQRGSMCLSFRMVPSPPHGTSQIMASNSFPDLGAGKIDAS
ncbi:hypothetical protein ACHAXH_000149 [Discostella pseudostelligera]